MEFSPIAIVYFIGYLTAIIAIVVWFRKIKKSGEKIPLRAKIFMAFIVLSGPSVIAVIFSPNQLPVSENLSSSTYYVKPDTANVRECPSTSCKILSTLSQNTELAFPGDLFDKYPDWVEVTFPDGGVGYVSKTVLSSETQARVQIETPSQPRGNEILLGEGDFEPLDIGYSYVFSFCVPESARSGATCGGLAGRTDSPVGGSPPYSISKTSGFLPPGMTLELNGLLSGSPTTAGTYNFKLCAKDLQMNKGCEDYTIVVEKTETAPVIPKEEQAEYSATIDSASCKKSNCTKFYCDYVVTAAGTATGPVGAEFSINGAYNYETDSIIDRQIYLGDGYSQIISNSWSGTKDVPSATGYTREAGESPTTSWQLTTSIPNVDMEFVTGPFETGVGVGIWYRSIKVYKTHEIVTCN